MLSRPVQRPDDTHGFATMIRLSLALSLLLILAGCRDVGVAAERAPRLVMGDGGAAVHTGTKSTAESDLETKDYWGEIRFGRTNFTEVRAYVREQYIETKVNQSRGWAEAASFALASEEDHELLLLPEAFYTARKDHEDEEGRLQGKMQKLEPTDGFVIVEFTDPKKNDSRRLTDDEIRALRDKDRARRAFLEERWKETQFARPEFDRVMGFIKANFGKTPKWSIHRAWVAAAQGYLYSLDPHSSLIARAAWEDSTRDVTDASFEGIGAILTRRPGSDYTIVESPIDGQAAVKAGVRAGDTIIAVDGHDIKGMLLPKVVKRIKGPKGTTVILTVDRLGEPKPLDIPIVRSRIDIKNVQGQMVSGHSDIGYIKVTGFVPTTNREMGRMYRKLTAQSKGGKLKGLILDLRRNSGGLLQQGILMADRFLERGTIVSVRNRGEPDEVHRATERDTWDVPLVVVVDYGSASASEIVASALQDNGRALVVGDRTFGKASVQTLFTPLLRDDYYIKLTVARYYSPGGRTLQVVGVHPDVDIPPDVGGDMPLGFREEDLSHHLDALNQDYDSPNAEWSRSIAACAERTRHAERSFSDDPNPAVKFDYPMMKGADLLSCMVGEKRVTRAVR
jgi:C-terminal peptidase prc